MIKQMFITGLFCFRKFEMFCECEIGVTVKDTEDNIRKCVHGKYKHGDSSDVIILSISILN